MEISTEDAAMLEQLRKQADGMTCETCVFYAPIQTTALGEEPTWNKYGRCHRFPPKEVGPSCYTKVAFPAVEHDDWCGEHVERIA